MEKEASKPKIEDLRDQIDYLENKIRQAEEAATDRLEQSAPLESIYTWQAPERIYQQKDRRWYVTVAFIVMIIITYAALTANYLLIGVLITLLFLLYAMNTFPPRMVTHEILNKGIKTLEEIYLWNKLSGFWISERSGQYVLNINLVDGRVNRMILLIGQGDVEKIAQELVKRVDYINPGGTRQDFLSKLTEGKHMPLTKFLDVFGEAENLPSTPDAKAA